MANLKSEKHGNAMEKKDKAPAAATRLRTLSVRSGVTAGQANMGCSPCHKPTNHNETLVAR
jgi:hypothetical protein